MVGHLYRITGEECAFEAEGLVQCPPNTGMKYRAGFKETPEGWRMVYFVAGD